MPKFQKGHTGMGGRPPGSKNKQTERLKQFIADLLEQNQEGIQDAMERLRVSDPRAYLQIWTQLTNKSVPNVTKTDITSDGQPFIFVYPGAEKPAADLEDKEDFETEDDE